MDRLNNALPAAAETPHNGNPGADETLGTAKQVKRHFGDVSDMWLWRRLHEDPTFPRPLVIRGRRFWRWSTYALGRLATPHELPRRDETRAAAVAAKRASGKDRLGRRDLPKK